MGHGSDLWKATPLLVAVLSWSLGQVAAVLSERRNKRIERADAQLEHLYGPLLALVTAVGIPRRSFSSLPLLTCACDDEARRPSPFRAESRRV